MLPVSPSQAVAGEIAFLVVTLLILLLRLYVRIYLLSQFALTDALIILAWVAFLANSLCDIYMNHLGFWDPRIRFTMSGKEPDFYLVTQDERVLRTYFQVTYFQNPLSFVAIYSIKTSFLLMYLKLFPSDMKKLRIVTYITLVGVIVGFVVIVCVEQLTCIPIQRNWTMDAKSRCLSWAKVEPYYIAAGFHIISDCFVYALPFFIIPRLYATATRKKLLGITILFSLGVISLACTIGRLINLGSGATQPVFAIWAAAEMCSGIFVACAPPLRWLWTSRRYYIHSSNSRARVGSDGRVEVGGKRNNRDWGLRKGSGSKPKGRNNDDVGGVRVRGSNAEDNIEEVHPGTVEIEKGTVGTGTVGTWTVDGSALNTVGTVDMDNSTYLSIDAERGAGGLGAPPRYKNGMSVKAGGQQDPDFQLTVEDAEIAGRSSKGSTLGGLWNKWKTRSTPSLSRSSRSNKSNASSTFGGGHPSRRGTNKGELSTFGGGGPSGIQKIYPNTLSSPLNTNANSSPSSPSFPPAIITPPTPSTFPSPGLPSSSRQPQQSLHQHEQPQQGNRDSGAATISSSRGNSPYPYGNHQRQQSAGFGFLTSTAPDGGLGITASRITVSSHGADSCGDDVRGSYASLTFGTGASGASGASGS